MIAFFLFLAALVIGMTYMLMTEERPVSITVKAKIVYIDMTFDSTQLVEGMKRANESLLKAHEAMKQVGISAQKAAENFKKFYETFNTPPKPGRSWSNEGT